jgi:hypothetical protein
MNAEQRWLFELYDSKLIQADTDIIILDSTELAMLTALASACVEDKGTAVYGAMAMLQAYNQTWVEPTNGSCHIEMQHRIAHKKAQQLEVVESPKIENRLLIYPNPATDKIEVNYKVNGLVQSATMQIKDVLGRIVSTTNVSVGDEFIEINTSKFVDGVYFISIIDNADNVLMTNKFIITK